MTRPMTRRRSARGSRCPGCLLLSLSLDGGSKLSSSCRPFFADLAELACLRWISSVPESGPATSGSLFGLAVYVPEKDPPLLLDGLDFVSYSRSSPSRS